MPHQSIPRTLPLFLIAWGVLLITAAPACGDGSIEITLPTPTPPQELVVYVTGEVISPDVYTLPPGADRVSDAIAAAGGFTENADIDSVNQAAMLSDGQHIRVSAIGEQLADTSQSDSSLIDINTASLELLQTLTGIGPVKAQAIIDYRQSNGPFARIEDILNVQGIGEATFESIKDKITAR